MAEGVSVDAEAEGSDSDEQSVEEPGTCFVMMPFRSPFELYYQEIIKPAIEAQGLRPVRGDSLFRPSPIMGDIWEMVQEAAILVAELTGKNPNVFYELGLAHALGKPVVMISETVDDVPFDLRALRVLIYGKDDPSWGRKLQEAIEASLEESQAEPVKAVPSMFRKIVASQAPEQSEVLNRLEEVERRVQFMRSDLSLLRGHDDPSSDPVLLSGMMATAAKRMLMDGLSENAVTARLVRDFKIPRRSARQVVESLDY